MRSRTTVIRISLLAGLALVVAACGVETVSDQTGPSSTAATEVTITTGNEPQPDYVEVNGANLAYECIGSGSPTVIFEHGNPPPGFEDYDPGWGGARVTIEAIAEFTTACIYGRRGVMGSDAVTAEARTAADQIADLNGFIETVGIETPIVLVGYSWGGELVRLFAGENPGTVSGLVLVDSRHPDNDTAFGIQPLPPQPPEMIDFPASEPHVAEVTDLGDLPIVILTSGEPFPGAPEDVFEIWWKLQDDLASLSTDTSSVRIEDSSHFDMPTKADEIASAVSDVIKRAGT